MTDTIGPAFGNELLAAGCGGLSISWTPAGLGDIGALSQAQATAVQAVLAAHLPARGQMLAQVNAKRDALIASGYKHNFGATAGIRTLDQRDVADKVNWLGLKAIADTLIAAGSGDQMLPLVDASNDLFETSATTASAAMLAMGMWQSSLIVSARNLKNEIQAALDAAALAAIDIEAGWPE